MQKSQNMGKGKMGLRMLGRRPGVGSTIFDKNSTILRSTLWKRVVFEKIKKSTLLKILVVQEIERITLLKISVV